MLVSAQEVSSKPLVHQAYKYRIYPNTEQKQLIRRMFGCCRFVFNYFL